MASEVPLRSSTKRKLYTSSIAFALSMMSPVDNLMNEKGNPLEGQPDSTGSNISNLDTTVDSSLSNLADTSDYTEQPNKMQRTTALFLPRAVTHKPVPDQKYSKYTAVVASPLTQNIQNPKLLPDKVRYDQNKRPSCQISLLSEHDELSIPQHQSENTQPSKNDSYDLPSPEMRPQVLPPHLSGPTDAPSNKDLAVSVNSERKNSTEKGVTSSFTLKCTTRSLFNTTDNNYLKGCKWSPDGLALVTASKDKILRIFNVPDLRCNNTEMVPVACHSSSNILYDYVWNPKASHLSAENCNLIISNKNSPIHLIDSFTGSTLANYVAFNHVEELISPFSMCYTNKDRILAGYCKHVREFNITRPGKESVIMSVGDKASQNNNSIVSALAPHPSMDAFAAGCYNSTLALYTSHVQGPVMPFYGVESGVTHLIFSSDGNRLYAGYRTHPAIHCFDTRSTGTPLYTATRHVTTPQRIYFDITRDEELLVSGNDNGMITLYDIPNGMENGQEGVVGHSGDVVNGVAFHPYWRILASTSGSRKLAHETQDNSLKIWQF